MSILELLQKAKKLYLCNQGKVGMCWCIKVVANEGKSREEQRDRGQIPYASIKSQIPEFNPWYLKSHKAEYLAINRHLQEGLEFWWDVDCVEPRIKAFDILIELYENIDREFVC
jgi:hypothetical protein